MMKNDIFGQQILDENDLCHVYLADPEIVISNALVNKDIRFDSLLDLKNIPTCKRYIEPTGSIAEFDISNQNNWFMPDEFKNTDIVRIVLDRCKNDSELQRVGQELLMFQERDLFPLLRYLHYLVETMRKHNIVWGVGRGSSVASFVLFLLGVHRINSLYYDLPIEEFLK